MRATIIAAFWPLGAVRSGSAAVSLGEFHHRQRTADNRVYSVCVDGGRIWAAPITGWRFTRTANGACSPPPMPGAPRRALPGAGQEDAHALDRHHGGLSRYSAGRIDSFTQLNSGLPNDVVYGVTVQGDLVWCHRRRGARLDTRTNQWSIFNERNTPCTNLDLQCDAAEDKYTMPYGEWGAGVRRQDRTLAEYDDPTTKRDRTFQGQG